MKTSDNQIKNHDFILYNDVKDFNKYVRLYIANNIPSVHRDIRIHLLDESYQLLSLLLSASYNKGNIRLKYLYDMRVKLSLLDYLISEIRDLKIIKNKSLDVLVGKIAIIKNVVYGWILNEEDKRK